MGPGMGMGMQMRPEMKQQLILAPRMIQSMEILQLPLQELQERIEQELVENPALELQERDPELPDEPVEQENPREKPIEDKPLVVDEVVAEAVGGHLHFAPADDADVRDVVRGVLEVIDRHFEEVGDFVLAEAPFVGKVLEPPDVWRHEEVADRLYVI